MVVTWGEARDTTDADGFFELSVDPSAVSRGPLQVHGVIRGFCDYCDYEYADGIAHEPLAISLLPGRGLDTSRYSSFLSFFRTLTATGHPRELLAEDVSAPWEKTFHGTHLVRWPTLPVGVALEGGGAGDASGESDRERDLLGQAMAEWEEKTGMALFREALAAEAQIVVSFRPGESQTRLGASWRRGAQERIEINIAPGGNDRDVLARAEHELGHGLFLLGHSRDARHVMFGGRLRTQRVTKDEAQVVRAVYGLPVGIDMERYSWPPDEESKTVRSDWTLVITGAFVLFILGIVAGGRS